MKKHVILGLLMVVLVAVFASLPVAADPNDRGSGVGTMSGGGFKVFDMDSLVAEWTITCSNGDTTTCIGSGGGCLRVCEEYCGESCTIILPE